MHSTIRAVSGFLLCVHVPVWCLDAGKTQQKFCPHTHAKPRRCHDFESRHEVLKLRGGNNQSIQSSPKLDCILHTFDLMGTGVFAFSGAVMAGKKGMDLLGMVVVASVTALGGGTVRDLLLDSGTVFWMRRPLYLKICSITAVASYLFWPRLEQRFGWKDSAKPICIADALGLAAFAVLGTQTAINSGIDIPIVWVVSGLMSACFGGIVRDLICLQRPRVMYPDRSMYAISPLIGAAIYSLLYAQSSVAISTQRITWISFLVTFALRVISFSSAARLPHWHQEST